MTDIIICTCPAGVDAPAEDHQGECPFPQGECELCGAPTDRVAGDMSVCADCFKRAVVKVAADA